MDKCECDYPADWLVPGKSLRHREHTYCTSLPLVSVHQHGRVKIEVTLWQKSAFPRCQSLLPCFPCVGPCSSYRTKETGARVPVHHREYGGGADCGEGRDEAQTGRCGDPARYYSLIQHAVSDRQLRTVQWNPGEASFVREKTRAERVIMKSSVAKHYGYKPARHCGLIANRRSQANRDFSGVRNMNCCFAHCAATLSSRCQITLELLH